MKKTFLSAILLGILVLSSCKNENKGNSDSDSKNTATPFFYTSVDVSAAQKDDMALYFTEDNSINFSGDKAEWKGTNGNNKREVLTFKLKEDKIPTAIRLDLGINKNQDSVIVNNVKIGYFDNEFTIQPGEFFKYFINNEKDFDAKIDSKRNVLKIQKKEGEYKTPYFYPTEELLLKIKEITTQKK